MNLAPLILASQSPRRVEILSFFKIPFKQISSDFDESQIIFNTDPHHFALKVARGKALDVSHRFPDSIVLGADTIVHKNGKIYLKPENDAQASQFLRELSGGSLEVITAVCVQKGDLIYAESEVTRLVFHPLTDRQIEQYHNFVHFADKSGAFAIEKAGSIILERIDGCFYNVLGLPINTTKNLLLRMGIDLWEYLP